MSFSSEHGHPSSGDRHGWKRLDGYFSIHDAQLLQLDEYFVEHDDLRIWPADGNTIKIEGRISCKDGLYVHVNKVLEINDRHQVRTYRYNYHAGIEGDPARSIFRYDNSHTYEREGQPDAHHKHCFNYSTWEEIQPPQWVGYERWPTLAQVIEELYDWWREYGPVLIQSDSSDAQD